MWRGPGFGVIFGRYSFAIIVTIVVIIVVFLVWSYVRHRLKRYNKASARAPDEQTERWEL